MTEQEKREKAIEEMAQLGSIVCKGCDCTRCSNCVHYNRAKALYDAGYRKAKEIFAKCKEKCMFEGYPYGIDYTELVEVFKEFGVEVEE